MSINKTIVRKEKVKECIKMLKSGFVNINDIQNKFNITEMCARNYIGDIIKYYDCTLESKKEYGKGTQYRLVGNVRLKKIKITPKVDTEIVRVDTEIVYVKKSIKELPTDISRESLIDWALHCTSKIFESVKILIAYAKSNGKKIYYLNNLGEAKYL